MVKENAYIKFSKYECIPELIYYLRDREGMDFEFIAWYMESEGFDTNKEEIEEFFVYHPRRDPLMKMEAFRKKIKRHRRHSSKSNPDEYLSIRKRSKRKPPHP